MNLESRLNFQDVMLFNGIDLPPIIIPHLKIELLERKLVLLSGDNSSEIINAIVV